MKISIFFSLLLFILNYRISYCQNIKDSSSNVEYAIESVILNNDTITYIHNHLNQIKKKPIIVFVQGSKPIPLFYCEKNQCNSIFPFNISKYLDDYNFVMIGRKGVPLMGEYNRDENGFFDSEGLAPNIYSKNDNLEYRVFQLSLVVDDLLKKKWVDTKNIFVVGHSEGYRVVAKFALTDNICKKYVFMSANPFNRDAETILEYRLNGLKYQRDTNTEVQSVLNDRNYYLNNINMKDLNFKNWYSYNADLTFNSLKSIKKSSLILYGSEDVSAIHNDLLNFLLDKSIFNIKALPNLDHNFFKTEYDENGNQLLQKTYQWDTVFDLVVKWLKEPK